MAIYGMKDAADLVLVNKRTKQPELYVNYANATSSEWSSESVYATKKGSNAIRWDSARNGTLTIDSELFDFGFLAMVMGSDIKMGRSNVFQRAEAVLDSTKRVAIGDASSIKPETISVIKLVKPGDVEHDGMPLFNASAATGNLPAQVRNVTVAVNKDTARITFSRANGADSYILMRNGSKVADLNTTSYTDTGLTKETEYTYEVRAVNEFGKGPLSAKVKPTTSAEGVEEFKTFTATSQDRNAAANNQGEVATPDTGEVTYSFTSGEIVFNDHAVVGDAYAIYYMQEVENVRTLTIDANKFADSYEIYATSKIRNQEDGNDSMVEIHYFNAKPQSNFTLTQSATEPTSLSVVFDLMPTTVKGNDILAEFKVIE
ncbi:fibronectin type III domain-containing protein [Aerococcaceae bacterium zg-B36]|uniref:fibronectin type III domain-containing protein n=1 Tax=Aerococcaceae bacterium zg-252 TaxID=2796928 RepID=UPI001BD8A2F4|nr:fibronectin type III domain-containing protein [Aerococcaceae bacterium zg-B36]